MLDQRVPIRVELEAAHVDEAALGVAAPGCSTVMTSAPQSARMAPAFSVTGRAAPPFGGSIQFPAGAGLGMRMARNRTRRRLKRFR
ncbi:hypothetical protein ACVWWN_006199 [Mycobacterium sp. URHB0021]|jgi:hypothetical protein